MLDPTIDIRAQVTISIFSKTIVKIKLVTNDINCLVLETKLTKS